MKKSSYDVLVIGAGPGGSVAARNLAKQGFSVLLIEKREKIGYPVRCGEASTKLERLQEEFGPIEPDCIETELNGLYVYGPGGVELDCKMPGVGVMLNREKFDPWLAHLAEEDGAEVETNARASAVGEVQNGYRTVTVETSRGTEFIQAKMVIAADGVESRIGRMVGLNTLQKPATACTGVDIQVKGILTKPDYLTFWQGVDYINDGYIWSFPKVKSNVTNFGAGFLISTKSDKCIEEVAFDWLKKLFPNAKVVENYKAEDGKTFADIEQQIGGIADVSSITKNQITFETRVDLFGTYGITIPMKLENDKLVGLDSVIKFLH